jgi:SAM-dependent methyltransferase
VTSEREARWHWGSFRRTRPLSSEFGFERGTPIDRHYIKAFLRLRQADIAGRVLEIGDASYTRAFGGARVTKSDVLHVHDQNPDATIIGDLASAGHIPDDTFDCLVVTQTLHLIYDLESAIATAARILRPGGTILATFPGISQISTDEWRRTWAWALSAELAHRLFARAFDEANVAVRAYGSSFAAACFLQGVAAEELKQAALDEDEPECELLVAVRASK